jgi:hypothetical protein
MPRSGTSFTQKFFNFAYQAGDQRYFAPDQELSEDDFFLKYTKKKYGEGSLYEDWVISRALHEGRRSAIPEAVSSLYDRWASWGEPVLKHLWFVLTKKHLDLFSHVIITYCDVDERWEKSVESQVEVGPWVDRHRKLFQANDVLGIGRRWNRLCWESWQYCKFVGKPASVISFGSEEQFVSAMCKLGYDQKLAEGYWSAQWQGSRFDERR